VPHTWLGSIYFLMRWLPRYLAVWASKRGRHIHSRAALVYRHLCLFNFLHVASCCRHQHLPLVCTAWSHLLDSPELLRNVKVHID
jgi:hypothetical protein